MCNQTKIKDKKEKKKKRLEKKSVSSPIEIFTALLGGQNSLFNMPLLQRT